LERGPQQFGSQLLQLLSYWLRHHTRPIICNSLMTVDNVRNNTERKERCTARLHSGATPTFSVTKHIEKHLTIHSFKLKQRTSITQIYKTRDHTPYTLLSSLVSIACSCSVDCGPVHTLYVLLFERNKCTVALLYDITDVEDFFY